MMNFSDMMREEGNSDDFVSFVNEKMLIDKFYAARREKVCQ